MTGLLGIEDSADRRDGLGRGHALGLIQDHPAMNGVALPTPSHGKPAFFVREQMGAGKCA